MKKRDLMFAHFGNGLTVADRLHEKHGDYERVAHINADRSIEYYVKLSKVAITEIEEQAKTSDPSVSTSQDAKVFLTRPE